MKEYNRGLPAASKQAANIGWLYNKIHTDLEVQKRVFNLVRDNYGMIIKDVDVLFSYKLEQNHKVHRDSLNRGRTMLELFQQLQYALRILCLAPDQPLNFPRAFEKCARWVYKRNQTLLFHFLVSIHQTYNYFIEWLINLINIL